LMLLLHSFGLKCQTEILNEVQTALSAKQN
jgi:hypothetical protein